MRSRIVTCSSFFAAVLAANCAADDQANGNGSPDDMTADGGHASDGGSSGGPVTPDDEEPGTERCAEPPCANGEQCITSDDCTSLLCRQGICFPPGAGDGVQNGDETDVDCGGNPNAAPPCAAGKRCRTEPDCQSRVCTEQVCQAPSASDGVRNGDETDIDCGGAAAPACDDGKTCFQAGDCVSEVCDPSALRCLAPTANDGVQNGDETDIDCGGPGAPACVDARRCQQGSDCASLSCQNQICVAPTANDGIKNGNETDVDCGRAPEGVDTNAGPCAAGKSCLAGTDCSEGYCPANGVEARVCVVPTANDGIKNGNESDVDCGRSGAGFDTQAPACAAGKRCTAHRDCASDGCVTEGAQQGRCAKAPSCAANHGGQTCGAGEVGQAGAQHEDCCASLPVDTAGAFSDALHPGKRVYLDKYEVTAGRIREFLARIAADNQGVPRVQDWMRAKLAAEGNSIFWTQSNDIATDWTRWLPNGASTPVPLPRYNTYRGDGVPVSPDPWGDVGTDYVFGPSGWYFYVHGHNCDGGSGYPTYWHEPQNWQQIHGGTPANRMTREQLDVRSMNCIPTVVLAAFCVWDGGQLATTRVLSHVTNVAYANKNAPTCTSGEGCVDGWRYGTLGRLGVLTEGMGGPRCSNQPNCATPAPCPGSPGCALANYSNDAGQLLWGPQIPYFYRPGANDPASRVAAPGRITTDALRIGANDEPWMDLRGNLQELSLDDRATPTASKLGGVHYDGIGRRAKGAAQQQAPEFKVAQAGGRCMRFRDQ